MDTNERRDWIKLYKTYNKQYNIRIITKLTNEYQRLYHYGYEEIDTIKNDILNSSVPSVAKYYLNQALDEFNKKKDKFLITDIRSLEQFVVQIKMDGNLFSKNKLFRPEASFGRYLVANPDDAEVIDKAYNYLIDTYQNETANQIL